MPEICSFSTIENYFVGRRDVGCDNGLEIEFCNDGRNKVVFFFLFTVERWGLYYSNQMEGVGVRLLG